MIPEIDFEKLFTQNYGPIMSHYWRLGYDVILDLIPVIPTSFQGVADARFFPEFTHHFTTTLI